MNLKTLAATGATALGAAWVLSASAPAPAAVDVGDALPAAELADFAQTPATSLSDFFGQAVLLEFFAYW